MIYQTILKDTQKLDEYAVLHGKVITPGPGLFLFPCTRANLQDRTLRTVPFINFNSQRINVYQLTSRYACKTLHCYPS